ncbi:MAG: redoxin domain-containing protein [Flavobacteriales bacterium]|nr:redoxin domain-containing protein [Flavobacteriales bacterium]
MRLIPKQLLLILLLSCSMLSASEIDKDKGYELKFEIDGLRPDTIYMLSYKGNVMNHFDTAFVDNKGAFVFKNDKKLLVGMYGVYSKTPYNGTQLFIKFIGKEKTMSMKTDTLDFINNLKIEGSKENSLFFGMIQYSAQLGEKATELSNKLKDEKKDSDKYNKIKKEISAFRDKYYSYRDSVINNYPKLFVATILRTSIDPVIPEIPILPNGREDSTFSFRYYKKHYFDNIDLSDRRLFRSQIMHNKVFNYLDKMTPMIPDSIIKSVDVILKGTKEDSVTFRYFAAKLLYRYDTSKVVGMSNVLFHIANEYYKDDKAYWMDSTQMADVKRRVEMLRYNQIGKQAIDLSLPDWEGKKHRISDIKSDFTILFFYSASCGHCKKEAPKLLDLYHKYGKDVVSVYAVEGTNDRKKWEEFVKDLELDWINVADPDEKSHFRQYYDVRSFPTVYLLDKRKKILLKRVSVESLDKTIERDKAGDN